METALDVLSRAATMVQDSTGGDLRLMTKKELPIGKWRRERRHRAEMYHITPGMAPTNPSPTDLHLQHHHHPHHGSPQLNDPTINATVICPSTTNLNSPLALTPLPSHSPSSSHLMMSATTTLYPHHPHAHPFLLNDANKLTHSTVMPQMEYDDNEDSPLDMTISTAAKQEQALDVSLKKSSSSISPTTKPSIARPSVITQAPSKRETHHTINEEPLQAHSRNMESVSMCDNVIDEHFRRSLGPDYALINKKLPAATPSISTKPLSALTKVKTPPIVEQQQQQQQQQIMPESLVMPKQHMLSPLSSNSDAITRKTHSQIPTILEKPTVVAAVSSVAAAAASATAVADTPYVLPQEDPLPLHRYDTKILYAPTSTTNNNNNNSPPISVAKPTNAEFATEASAFRCVVPQSPPVVVAPSSITTTKPTTTITAPSPYSPSYGSSTATVASNSSTSNSNVVPSPIMRIKTETNLNHFNISATNTPPASPNSLSNVSTNSSDVLASVDDHFAKALGDAWKKLKENDNAQKKTSSTTTATTTTTLHKS